MAEGELIAHCGPSGSDRSTLIRCVNRLEDFQSGEIAVAGKRLDHNLKNIDAVRREVGMHYLERVRIPEQAGKFPGQISGGQEQRVAIVRALCMKPRAMMFDEPTPTLDAEMVKGVLDTMVSLAEDGMTMIVVTHEVSFARRVADRVLSMEGGSIVRIAEPDRFFDAPQNQRMRRFLEMIL
uniref:General L-amino acid ABC transporter ATP-binding protein n=1 Tax=Aureimonas frigidaquae TaxID=424757 RepID=A0A0P0Z2L0_9HYPH|nr:general L-amino acid ABC transporter ATP-binding protein [Aureimonas frigidaquae]